MNIDSKVFFAMVSAVLCVVCVGIVAVDDDLDAAVSGSGTEEDPFIADSGDLVTGVVDFCYEYIDYLGVVGDLYFEFESGSAVNITSQVDVTGDIFSTGAETYVVSSDPGSLVSYNASNSDRSIDGSLSGNATEDFSIKILDSEANEIFTVYYSVAQSIDFTSPDAIEAVSKSTISYTAAANIPATFSEAGGSAASWLDVDSVTGKVAGQVPTVSTKTTYTYVVEATSTGDSTNTTQQTITIDVWPVAQITASQRVFDVVQNDVFSGITLSGNIPMSFSIHSGEFPEGITMSSAGEISGTPTGFGQYSVTVKGTTSEGPVQNPTIVIVMNVDEDEPVLSITVGTPEGPYKVGTSLSFPLTSNVSGTTWSVSGDAADWMSVSGSNVVGSVPSSYDSVTEVSLTVSADTPQGQTASQTISFSVEPIIQFTTVPTADAVIIPVYDYNDDGTVVQSLSLFEMVDAATDFSFTDTLTIQATFTGENAETVIWDWGDGSEVQIGNKFTHTYEQPGTYTITLTASNDVGSDTVEITITVGESQSDLLFIGVIALLFVAVLYLVYRLAVSGKRRGH